MKWEEYNPYPSGFGIKRMETEIECPECGNKLYKRTDIILTTVPPKYQYECRHCGYIGYKFA